ncbi:hypothetical protein [Flavobacterium sp. DG2-3]|uniref:hypothetical protein n=1 Tax=Flavobacterium sp. DG2-3 TaxID=3068317 RepID=UPI00273CF673|nr:hypothetical protein [Flavobacterium sp. DG2-3]MDP5200213.1 hypothetical protein [Flavobacterium sp. DG2-3]
MSTKNYAAKVFDTVMSIQSMSEPVKIDLKISRKNVLLLCHFIDRGVLLEKDEVSLMGSIAEEELAELKNVSKECLQKAGLVELNQKLLSFIEDVKT